MRRILFMTATALCAVTAAPRAQGAVDFVPTATFYDGGRRDVCLVQETLYVASATGLEVFEVSDPGRFRRVGQIIRPEGCTHVAVAGRFLALVTGNDSLLVFARVPAGVLTGVGFFPLRGEATALSAGPNAFFVADSAGWCRVSLTASPSPEVDFSTNTSRPVNAFGVRGDSLFALEEDGTTAVFSVAGLPIPRDTLHLRASISAIIVQRDFVFAAAGDSGVVVYELRPAHAAMEVGRYFTYGRAVDLAVMDTLLVVADAESGLLVLSLSDPSQPSLVDVAGAPRGLRAVAADGAEVAAAGENGLFLFALADPLPIRQTGRHGGAYRVGDLATRDNLLAASVVGIGLALLNLADPVAPVVISETAVGSSIRGLDVAGKLVGLAAENEGLVLVIVANPDSPVVVFRQPTIGVALDVALDDSLAVVADGGEGFRIFEVTDPAQARLIGGKSTTAAVTAVAHTENHVFAVGPELGLEVYDISFAFKPQRVYAHHPPGRCRSLTVDDRRGFLAVDSAGILVFDLQQPGAPKIMEQLDVVAHPRRIVVDGGLVLVADDSLGLVAIDYRRPGAAAIVASMPLAEPPTSVGWAGDAVYVSGDSYLLTLAILPPMSAGDIDGNGSVSLADVVYLVNYLFRQGPLPFRASRADLDRDGRLNIVDLVRLIRLVLA